MSTLAFSSAGSKILISAGVPATYDATGFGALSYTEINSISDIGVIGDVASLITFMPVNNPTTFKLKGNTNSGVLSLKGAFTPTDPGQVLLMSASNSYNPYAIKILLANSSIIFAQGLVMGVQTTVGTVNQITGLECNVELSGGVVRV
jgi:hypothetical protein